MKLTVDCSYKTQRH